MNLIRLITALTAVASLLVNTTSAKADEWQPYAGKQVIQSPWQGFSLNQVHLSEGSPMYEAMMHHSKYVLSLEIDRLIGHVLKFSGLEAKGKPYGGWEPSITYGHYMSSLSLYWAATGDNVYMERLDYLLSELKRCSESAPAGWFIGGQNKGLDLLMEGNMTLEKSDEAKQPWNFNGIGNSWYGIHKVLAGLRDAYIYAGKEVALQIALPLIDRISEVMLSSNRDLEQAMLSVEQGGMAEVMADFYSITGEKKYLETSLRFTHINVVYPTAEGEDVLKFRHANDQIPKFIGASKQYLLTGRDVFRRASRNFWDIVTEHHTLANGGNGCFERFGDQDKETSRLDATPAETCNTYNMLKLSHNLFLQTGDEKYMNYYEWALYNHILASLDPCHSGLVTYYTSLRPGDYKRYSKPYDSFWCCVGTGMENHAKYGENIFFHNGKDLYLSLFIPCVLDWADKGVKIEVSTQFPASDTVKVKVLENSSFDGELLIRHPQWAEGMKIIGKTKKLKKGNEITIVLPRSLYLRPSQDEPHFGSLCYGPLLLAGNLGTENMTGDPRRETPMQKFPALVGSHTDLDSWIKQDPQQPLHFTLTSQDTSRWTGSFEPYYKAHHYRFSVYWKHYSEQEYDECLKAYTDKVIIGDPINEQMHHLQGVRDTIHRHDYQWGHDWIKRWAEGGEFSYSLKTDPSETRPYTLVCDYWGDEEENCRFEILVEGEHLADVNLHRLEHTTYLTDFYTIPKELTTGRESVRVTFRAKEGYVAGPLYGLRITADTQYK